MRILRYPVLCGIFLFYMALSSCDSDFDLAETVLIDTNESGGANSDEGDMSAQDNDNTDQSDDNGNSTGEVNLIASATVLTNNGEGAQAWDENVSLSAVKINGETGAVVFETRFRDDGFGVAGGRWEQIDYYHEYQGEIVMASEKLVIDFLAPVTDITIQVGQMDPEEGRQAKEGSDCSANDFNIVDESGKWTAFDSNGMEIGTGIFLDEFSIEGQLPNSMGSYRFLLDTNGRAVSKIVIEATQWGGERGCPTGVSGYADEPLNDSGNTENNSEFNIMALAYTKV